MFEFAAAAGSDWPPFDSADDRRAVPLTRASARARPGDEGIAPCRITVESRDMTSDDRVHELFDRCRLALRDGRRYVIIDLNAVTAADTKIVACIVALYQIARSGSARLEICLSKAVREVARLCRLERLVQELDAEIQQRML